MASLQPKLVQQWLADRPGDRKRTVAGTVVSADISGFTRLAESLAGLGQRHAAERLITIINDRFAPMIEEINRRGGDVLKFGGDALFVLFDGPDHAVQACAAAASMMRGLTETNVEGEAALSMTIGVATGDISLLLAGDQRRELVVCGAVIDACLQCESDAEPGEILLHSSTARLLPTGWLEEIEEGVVALRGGDEVAAVDAPVSVPAGYVNDVDWEVALGADIASAIRAFDETVGENRIVNVAFVALPTDQLTAAEIDRVVERAIQLCDQYGPTLLSTDVSQGGIKLFFASGAPVSGDDDEGALLAVLSKLVKDPASPPMRAGVNRGMVYAGFLGSDQCRTLTVMGDPTNLAARLLGHAPERSIAVADSVLTNARGWYTTTELPPILVRGRLEPVKVHVLGELQAPSRQMSEITPPFVGRNVELAILRRHLADLVDRQGSVVDLVGESGIGSSRIARELVDELPATVLCFELEAGVATLGDPFGAIRPLLRTIAGLQRDPDDPEHEAERLEAWVQRVAPQHLDRFAGMAPALGITTASFVDEVTLPEFRMERVVEALRDCIAASIDAPAVIIAENLHWFDSGSRASVEALADRAHENAWWVITSSRPGELTPGGPESQLPLPPLTPEDIEQLLSSIGDLPQTARRQIVERSGGNPLFAIELAAALESGQPLSDSLEGQVTARIDRFGHDHRAILRSAAVLGNRFERSDLAELLGEPVPEWLSDVGLLESEGEHLRFRSQLIRDIAYAGLPARRRIELHAVAARLLSERGAPAAQLAWHFGQANDNGECWRYANVAAAEYAELGLLSEAFDQLSTAVQAVDRDPSVASGPELAAVLTESFHVGLGAKRHTEALAVGRRALTLIDDEAKRIDLLVAFARTAAEAEGNYAEQIAMLEAENEACGSDKTGRRSSAALLGALAALQYRYASAAESLALAESSASLALEVEDLGLRGRALLIAQVCLSDMGDPRRTEVGDELLSVVTELGDRTLLVSARSNVGVLRQDVGDWDGALEQFALAQAVADELGDLHRKVFPVVNRASLLADRGRWDEARPVLEELHSDARFDRSGFVRAWICSELGRLEACAGRADAARAWLAAALEWFDEAKADSEIYQLRVSLLAADLAEGRSEHVLSAAALIDQPHDIESRQLGRFDTIVGYAYLQQGRPEDSVAHFEQAVAATSEVYVFGHALALAGLAEAYEFLGRGRSAKRHRAAVDEVLATLGVERLPIIPLPR